MAKRINRSPGAVTKGARLGKFGKAARLRNGVWQFRWPFAEQEWHRLTDRDRLATTLVVADERRQRAPSVVYQSERGMLEISQSTFRALEHACANPDEASLTPELIAALNSITFIQGLVDERPEHFTSPTRNTGDNTP